MQSLLKDFWLRGGGVTELQRRDNRGAEGDGGVGGGVPLPGYHFPLGRGLGKGQCSPQKIFVFSPQNGVLWLNVWRAEFCYSSQSEAVKFNASCNHLWLSAFKTNNRRRSMCMHCRLFPSSWQQVVYREQSSWGLARECLLETAELTW